VLNDHFSDQWLFFFRGFLVSYVSEAWANF